MIHLIMISAIALAIGIGYRTKINIGLLAIAFSYLIATTLMGLSPKELLHFASACMNNRAFWWLSSQESACQHRIYEFDP